jgi:GntR family transcriptional regulator
VLGSALGEARAEEAEALRIGVGAAVVRVRRVRTGNGQPIGLQEAALVGSRFPGLERVELAGASLYDVLRERYGVTPVEAFETFTVAPIQGDDAELLRVAPGACGFRVHRVTFDARDPFEFTTSVMRGDRYRIRLALRNL